MSEPGLWADLRAAIRGTERDYTVGPVGTAVLLLAVPMVLETVMESLFAVVDIFFVSKLGPAAVATVALTESLMTLVFTLALGLSIGVTATVARRIGEKNPEGAAEAAAQAVWLGVGVALCIGLIGTFYAEALLAAMGASEEVIRVGSSYARTMLGFNGTVLLLFLINAAFRGAGDAASAMRVLWLANGINIVLDPLLIFGVGPFPEMGVHGAAVATNIGRGIAVSLQLWLMFFGSGRLRLALRHLRVVPGLMWKLIRLSGTGTFQVFVGVASWIGLVRILSSFGDEVLAGYAVGIRLIMFALLPSWGMSNAAATLVGQNLGAARPERAEKSVWIAGFYNMIFLGAIGALFLIFAPSIVGFFNSDPEPLRWGIRCLRIVSVGFLFYAYGMVLTQSFNGAGDAWTPTWINLLCFWLFELPFGYVAAHLLGWGPDGVFAAMTIAFSSLAVVSGWLFRRGRWKTKIV